MAAKKGLGKGLDSLIPKNDADAGIKIAVGESPVEVDINKVEPNKEQPRHHFDEDKLEELTDSVSKYGIIQPIVVQDRKTYYEIIAGERRWRAARNAGLKTVPVIIKNYTEMEIVEISLIENLQRDDLDPIEEALAYKKLIEEFNLKQDEVAEKVSKSRATVTNSIRLLKLDERVQQMIIDDMISTGHARAILGIADKDKQYEFAQKAFDEKLSVREVEKEVKNIQNEKKREKKSKANVDDTLATIYSDLEEQLKKVLGTKVLINAKDSMRGKLEIEYYSQDELDRIINIIKSAK